MDLLEFLFGKRSPSASPPEIDQSQTAAEPAGGTAPGKYISYSQAELRELGCIAAETGRGLKPYILRINEMVASHETAIQGEYVDKANRENARLRTLEAERDSLLAPGGSGRAFTTAASLESELDSCNTSIADVQRIARASAGSGWSQADRNAIKDLGTAENEWFDTVLPSAQKLYTVTKNSWSELRDELERQATTQEAKRSECQAVLAVARKRVESLHDAGVTRHVSGFLIWASSASLLGTGIAVTQVVRATLASPKPEGKNGADSLIEKWLSQVETPLQLLSLFAAIMGVLLLPLLVVGGVTALVRYVMRRSDPGWQKRPGQSHNSGGDGWLGWLGMFGARGMKQAVVTDHSLQQLIGTLPLIFAGAVMALVFISFGERSSDGVSLIASQLGPTFVLLSVVTAMLFATNLLDRRTDVPAQRLRIILFGVLGVLPSVSLALAGLLPPDRSRLALTAVSVAMMLAASGLAFGLIYRGHFSREEYLERELARCEERIVALRQQPTLAGVVYAQFGDMSEHIREGVRARFAAGRAWRSFRRRLKWQLRGLRRGSPDNRYEVMDADPLDELNLSAERLAELNKLRSLRDQLRARWERLASVEKERKESDASLSAATLERLTRLEAVKVEQIRAVLELENAHDIGKTTLAGPYDKSTPPPEPVAIPRLPDMPDMQDAGNYHTRGMAAAGGTR